MPAAWTPLGRHACALAAVLALAACGGGGTSADDTPATGTSAALSATASLGAKIFQDTSLSASGRQSCATCHDPANAHGAPNGLAAQLGGALLDQQGSRQAGTVRYLGTNTAFHFDSDESSAFSV